MTLQVFFGIVAGSLAGSAGTAMVFLLRWFFTRPARQAKARLEADKQRLADEKQKRDAAQALATQQQAIDDSNDRLGAALRDEMRRDNESLRDRLRQMETKQAATESSMATLTRSNSELRAENMNLSRSNGEQAEKLVAQAGKLASQAERIDNLERQIEALQEDRLVLIDAMRKAGVPIPPPVAPRKPGTGPLGPR